MSHPVCKLLGKHLVRVSDGQKELTTELPHGVILALFFTGKSALEDKGVGSNQGQNFSTRLMEFYKRVNSRVGISFEVIQIPLEVNKTIEEEKVLLGSQTKNETPFLAIHGEHSRKIEEYLIRKYEVQSPEVILIDGVSGHVINFQGKAKILEDHKGTQFPWRYPKCSELLGSGHLVTSSTSTDQPSKIFNASQIKGCLKGFYFGAYWCPPCRNFLPLLIDIYRKINGEKKKFEIIFVSSDRSKESFDRFFSSMPFPAIPYEDEKRREELTAMYNINGIPSFIIIDAEDNIITLDGRSEINEDAEGVDFPWYPKVVEELRDKHSTILNHSLCLMYFLDSEADYEKAEVALLPIATQFMESDMEEAMQPKFFIATDCELSESLRIFIDLDESSSHLVVMDIPNSRYAVANNTQIVDENSIREFLHKFQTSHNQLDYRYIQSRFI